MDSLKETDKPAPNPSKHPRIEVDEELMRQKDWVQGCLFPLMNPWCNVVEIDCQPYGHRACMSGLLG